MGFIGIPSFNLPFPLADIQAKWLIATWQGKVELPSHTEMLKASQKPESPIGLVNARNFHKLIFDMFPYMKRLADEADFEFDPRILQTIFQER